MQLTWKEDDTVFEDEDDDMLLDEDIVMLELSWLEDIAEDCMEDEVLKDDFCIWLPKDSLVSSWNVPSCREEELIEEDWDCPEAEAWVWEKLMLLPFCWKVLGFLQGFINVMHLCKSDVVSYKIFKYAFMVK